MNEKNLAKEFVESAVRLIASYPDEVSVERTVDNMGVLLTVSLNPSDCGMIIGRGGVVVNSLRRLASVIGIKNGERISIKITDYLSHHF